MRFTDFDAVLFDIDGTLCAHDAALPGAVEAVHRVCDSGVKHAFITNNSASTVATQVARLTALGMPAEAREIYTSGSAMADWIRSRWRRPRVFNFAGEALADELSDIAEFIEDDDNDDGHCDVVAVGTHLRENDVPFDYARAMLGLWHLRRGADLLVGSADRVYMYGGRPEFGSGAWGALFAFAADLPRPRIHYAGKPDPEFFLHLCDRLDVKPSRCLLVGDNLESDIAGGLSAGMTTALVLTGVVTREEQEAGNVKPHAVFDDLGAMLREMG